MPGYVVKPGLKCSALPEVKGVLQNARSSLAGEFGTVVRASIIDTHNVSEVIGEVVNNWANHFRFIENRNDNPCVVF